MGNKELIFLGTGHAMVTKCYNTCFAIHKEEAGKDEYFLVDAGGGNGILAQLEKANIPCENLRGMFVTHGHTDHILGAVWVLRKIASMLLVGEYPGTFTLYCHKELWELLHLLCQQMLHSHFLQFFGKEMQVCILEDGAAHDILGMPTVFFDIDSDKAKQYGFQMQYEEGKYLTCLGDEPYHDKTERWAKNVDWLLCEAYCLYEERDVFRPYEKFHSTVKDAGEIAEKLGVKNVILYHTEDSNLVSRAENYKKECSKFYMGNIFVPDDLEKISI